jgi:DNA invertase Pin-like site-specific DNA recombinase
VRAYVAVQGWMLVAEHEDVASGKDDCRPGFQAALARCRQLVAARLDRITRRAHTLSQLLEEGVAIRAADMPGADELMLRIYAAMAQKERKLISARTKAALAAAKVRGAVLGGDRGWRPPLAPDAGRASLARQEAAQRAAHRLVLEVERLRGEGITSQAGLARAHCAGRTNAARWSCLDAHDGRQGGQACASRSGAERSGSPGHVVRHLLDRGHGHLQTRQHRRPSGCRCQSAPRHSGEVSESTKG